MAISTLIFVGLSVISFLFFAIIVSGKNRQGVTVKLAMFVMAMWGFGEIILSLKK